MERGVLLRCAPGAKGDELRPVDAHRRAVPVPEDAHIDHLDKAYGIVAGPVVRLAYGADLMDDSVATMIETVLPWKPLGACSDRPGVYFVESEPDDYSTGCVDERGRWLWWGAVLEGPMAQIARRIVAGHRAPVVRGMTLEVSDRLKRALVTGAATLSSASDLRTMISRMFGWDRVRIEKAIYAARGD